MKLIKLTIYVVHCFWVKHDSLFRHSIATSAENMFRRCGCTNSSHSDLTCTETVKGWEPLMCEWHLVRVGTKLSITKVSLLSKLDITYRCYT